MVEEPHRQEIELTLVDIINRVENTKTKFTEGTAQHSLQKNRLKALRIALSIVSGHTRQDYSRSELKDAVAPLESLISKSEKARQKVAIGSWQYTMLTKNLEALYVVLPLLKKAITQGEHND